MAQFKYLAFLIFAAVTFISLYFKGWFLFLPIIFVFILIPFLDFILGTQKTNLSEDQFLKFKSQAHWAPVLFLYFLTHFFILVFGIFQSAQSASLTELLLLALTTGLYTGGIGITVAHELCHKKEYFYKLSADLLLSSVFYQHFAVEHIKGHHFKVATPEDPASARYNENIYWFLIRSIAGSFTHALKLDRAHVLQGLGYSLLMALAVFLVSAQALLFFVLQAVVAFILLEMVNYIEHYGLERKQLDNGRYEKVLPAHSWNSSHLFSNLLLFNLQRHSDHHARAHLPYTVLKDEESAPQLPSGYPAMILVALVPPVWFKLMNPKLGRA